MPLRESEIRFDEEIERIENEREELAEKVAEADNAHPRLQEWVQRGQQLDAHLDGLYWARDAAHDDDDVPIWDADVDGLTLSGLTGGEFGAMEAEIAGAAEESNKSAAGAQRVYQVRAGTVDAPYLDPSMSDNKQLGCVASLPVGFLKWAESRIDNLSSVGGNERQSFGELLAEKQSKQSEKHS